MAEEILTVKEVSYFLQVKRQKDDLLAYNGGMDIYYSVYPSSFILRN